MHNTPKCKWNKNFKQISNNITWRPALEPKTILSSSFWQKDKRQKVKKSYRKRARQKKERRRRGGEEGEQRKQKTQKSNPAKMYVPVETPWNFTRGGMGGCLVPVYIPVRDFPFVPARMERNIQLWFTYLDLWEFWVIYSVSLSPWSH